MTSRIGSAAIRVLGAAAVMFLGMLYLKLGYFMIFLHALGALAAVLLTRKQRAGYPPVWSSLVAIAAYGAAVGVVWSAATQNRDEVRELTWEIVEIPPSTQPEVRLHLDATHYLYSYSAELADYLRSRSREAVPVLLPVSRTLGCFESLGAPRIEDWGVVPVAGYAAGDGAGPWEEHWWCP